MKSVLVIDFMKLPFSNVIKKLISNKNKTITIINTIFIFTNFF